MFFMRGSFIFICFCHIHALSGASPPENVGAQSNNATPYILICLAVLFAMSGFACCLPKRQAKSGSDNVNDELSAAKKLKLRKDASLRPNVLLLEPDDKTKGMQGKSPANRSSSRIPTESAATKKNPYLSPLPENPGIALSARSSASPRSSATPSVSKSSAALSVSKSSATPSASKNTGDTGTPPARKARKTPSETPTPTSNAVPSATAVASKNEDELEHFGGATLDAAATAGETSLYNIHGLDVGKLLGQGSFGRVFLCKKQKTGKLLAVKVVPVQGGADAKTVGGGSLKETVDIELNLLKVLVHRHVVHYYGHFFSANQDCLCLVLEYVPGGTVKSQLLQFGGFSDSLVKRYAKQTLSGIFYLHNLTPPVIHRDLKPANLLLTLDGKIKITDFGSAKVRMIITGGTAQCTLKGSVAYMAPEVFSGKEVGCQQDIWSFGCLVLEMCIAKTPWWDYKMNNIMQAFSIIGKSDKVPTAPEGRPDVMVKFMYCCMRRDPHERLSAKELLVHEFLMDKDKDLTSHSTSAKSHRSKKKDNATKTRSSASGGRRSNPESGVSKIAKESRNKSKSSGHA
eukprot:GEMP01012830.1.p1 GENE.GEMP01012830.1~~GEMP01012830.1.p1  ORF type:complete len:573 (+),score=73.44 GEMP01012830.1:273-1991(+)